ncbi:MAG: hypothetical protein AAGF47_01730 [Planctomycetota bacterium]
MGTQNDSYFFLLGFIHCAALIPLGLLRVVEAPQHVVLCIVAAAFGKWLMLSAIVLPIAPFVVGMIWAIAAGLLVGSGRLFGTLSLCAFIAFGIWHRYSPAWIPNDPLSIAIPAATWHGCATAAIYGCAWLKLKSKLDRRSSPNCERCGYPLEGLPGDTCPECVDKISASAAAAAT